MKKAPKILNDQKRLEKLYSFNILDSDPAPEFDAITRLGSQICESPICVISLVDKDRQWFKSKVGLDACETPRDISFCGHAIESDDLFIVENALEDSRFCDNPLVTGGPEIKFYAGAPLVTEDGYRLGTICVIDSKPKTLSESQKQSLKDLSSMVMSLLNLGYKNQNLDELKTQYEDVQEMSHTGGWELDLKTSNTTWSKEVYRIHGIPYGQPTNKVDGISFYAPHERERITKFIENCISKRESFDEVFEFFDANDKRKWVRSIGRAVVNEENDVVKLIGTFQDVTEARNKEFEFDLILKNTKVGIWKLNLQTNELIWDDSMYRLFDVDKEKFSGAYDAWVNTLAPDYKEQATAEINEAIAGGKKFDTTFAIKTSEGKRRYIGARAEIERDEQGRPLMMTGINWDKTEEFIAQEKSKREEKARLNQLNTMMTSTPSCLKVITREGSLINMNPQGIRLIEAESFESVEGADVYQIVEESHREKFKEFNEKICEGNHGSLTFEIVGLKGTKRWMETFAAPFILDNGEMAHIAITNDISERIKSKEKFDQLLELNEEILNSTTEGILLVNHQTRSIQKFNDKFIKMWKIPKSFTETHEDEKMITFVLDQLSEPEKFVQLVEDLYTRPDEESFDTLKFKDGRIFDRYSTPLRVGEEIKGRLWFFRDVTEKRQLEQIVNHNSKLAAIGQLAAGVGHEINNPLTIIKGYVSTIKRMNTDLKEDIKLGLDKIDLASERIKKIVSGLRTFSRLEKEGESKLFNVLDLINEIESMISEIYRQEQVQLKFDCQNLDHHFHINGDRGKLEQVIMNLISNAKDATEDCEERIIDIDVTSHDHELVISVKDNGSGIAEENKKSIFDPFFTTKEVGKGTGIGLSLAHKFIHDDFLGSLYLSDTEHGAEFVIKINGQVNPIQLPVKSSSHGELNFNLKAIIADDEEGIRHLLKTQLEDIGIEAVTFENGELAYEHYLKNPEAYDLIISDIKMPKMDGPTLLKKIKNNEELNRPCFYFITGGVNINLDDPEKPYFKMLDGLIFKPFNLDDIALELSKKFDGSKRKSA